MSDIRDRLDMLDDGSLKFDAKALRASKCDECGKTADVIHFVSLMKCRDSDDTFLAYPHEGNGVIVKFSCPDHDFGGYCADFKRFCDPKEKFAEHIFLKRWGPDGIMEMNRRLIRDQVAGFFPPCPPPEEQWPRVIALWWSGATESYRKQGERYGVKIDHVRRILSIREEDAKRCEQSIGKAMRAAGFEQRQTGSSKSRVRRWFFGREPVRGRVVSLRITAVYENGDDATLADIPLDEDIQRDVDVNGRSVGVWLHWREQSPASDATTDPRLFVAADLDEEPF